jgi:hypothetical protein
METVKVPLKDIDFDPLGEALTDSPEMKPYLDHYREVMQGRSGQHTLKAIAALPKSKTYLHRVMQQLDLAFADWDSETVKLDLANLHPDDLTDLQELLSLRAYQIESLYTTVMGMGRE